MISGDFFEQKSVTIVTHQLYNGAAHDLRKFLIAKRCGELWFIGHDFSALTTRRSHLEHYQRGERVLYKQTRDYKFLPDTIVTIKDFLITLVWLKFTVKRTDAVIGLGAINTIAALAVKKACHIKSVIFYTIDFVPNRFPNKQLNSLYHAIDRLALRFSTVTWNVSPRMAEGRAQLYGLHQEKYPQRVVPIGIWTEEIPHAVFDQINKHELIYVGHLLKQQGVQVILRAIPQIVEAVPKFSFRIIGSGEYANELKRIVSDLKIGQYVIFEGAIYDQDLVNKKLALAAVGVAMYNTSNNGYTYYADPTKLKTYLAAGLPILLTDVPYNAADISRHGAGRIIKYDQAEIAAAVIGMLADASKLKRYRDSALSYSKSFDWNTILEAPLREYL